MIEIVFDDTVINMIAVIPDDKYDPLMQARLDNTNSSCVDMLL